MKTLLITIAVFISALTGFANQAQASNSPSISKNAGTVEEVRNLKVWLEKVKLGQVQPFSFDIGQQTTQLELIGAKDSPADKGWKKITVSYREKSNPLIIELTCEFPRAMDMVRTTLTLKTTGATTGNIRNIQILDLVVPKREAAVHGQSGGFSNPDNRPPLGSVPWIKTVVDGSPIEVDAGNDGRSSNLQLPIWLYAEKDGGFWYGPEWSGCWHMGVLTSSSSRCIQIGLPTFDFMMKEKEVITLPTVAFGPYSGSSDNGFNQLRRSISRYYLPTVDGKKPQPFVYWQGYGGHPEWATEEELYQEVDRAAQVGCEVFCLDGGWNMLPGARKNWFLAVGRWDDQCRFPKGVKAFGDYVKSKGMKFGIWIEPRAFKGCSMHDKNPELFYPGDQGLIRLDLPGGAEMFESVFEQLIRDFGADWVWLDFNVGPKRFWDKVEPVDRKGLVELGFYQGWYKAVDEVLRKHPNFWIESCASGGRIIDLGQLRRSQSIWVADDAGYDNTNHNRSRTLNQVLPAVYIQTSIFTPPGIENVLKEKPEPNTPLGGEHRFLTYFKGDFGFGQGLPYWREEDIQAAAKYTTLYKKYRHYLEGDYYNLLPMPTAWDVWDACQYHDTKSRSGILLVYRLQDNKQVEMSISPRITGKTDEYNWSVIAGNATVQTAGQNLTVRMDNAPGATLVLYERKTNMNSGKKIR